MIFVTTTQNICYSRFRICQTTVCEFANPICEYVYRFICITTVTTYVDFSPNAPLYCPPVAIETIGFFKKKN